MTYVINHGTVPELTGLNVPGRETLTLRESSHFAPKSVRPGGGVLHVGR